MQRGTTRSARSIGATLRPTPVSRRSPPLASPPGVEYESEINAAAEALVEDIGRRMTGGAALFIDYGFPSAEYYHPQRSEGTLMCHYRHRAHGDPFAWPGLTDITAHVDFTAMAEAGERAGLTVAGFTALAPFLIGWGFSTLSPPLEHRNRLRICARRPRCRNCSLLPKWGNCSRCWRSLSRTRLRGPALPSSIAGTGCEA